MAKARSITKISGTIGGVTHVDSPSYGYHTRNPRGTFTPITLADGMKTSGTEQSKANLMAKVIFDAVNIFAPNFKNGKFWPRLVSVFRQQKKAGIPYRYQEFNLMEMRWDYTSSHHGYIEVYLKGDTPSLKYQFIKDADYQLSILRIAVDETLLLPYPSEIITITTSSDQKSGLLPLDFPSLPPHTPIIYAVQCEELSNGKPNQLLSGRGLKLFCGV